MRNKKMITLLAAGVSTMVLMGGAAQAMTLGIANPDGTVDYYRCEPVEDAEGGADLVMDGSQVEKGQTQTFIVEDVQEGGSASGEISEKVKEGSKNVMSEPDMDGACEVVCEDGEELSSGDASYSISVEGGEDMENAGLMQGYAEGVTIWEESMKESDLEWQKREKERQKKQAAEYAEAGIGENSQGMWTWKGKLISILLDENGCFYQNGSEEAAADGERIYICVSRDKDGAIGQVETVSSRELLERIALSDLEQEN